MVLFLCFCIHPECFVYVSATAGWFLACSLLLTTRPKTVAAVGWPDLHGYDSDADSDLDFYSGSGCAPGRSGFWALIL